MPTMSFDELSSIRYINTYLALSPVPEVRTANYECYDRIMTHITWLTYNKVNFIRPIVLKVIESQVHKPGGCITLGIRGAPIPGPVRLLVGLMPVA